jgi:hypothetical protein
MNGVGLLKNGFLACPTKIDVNVVCTNCCIIYIVDFITAVKICESKLYRMYLDPTYSFLGEEFLQSLSLVADIPTFVEQDQSFNFQLQLQRVASCVQS